MEFDRFTKRLIKSVNVLVRKAALVANIDFGFLQSEEGRRAARIMWAMAKDRLFFWAKQIREVLSVSLPRCALAIYARFFYKIMVGK